MGPSQIVPVQFYEIEGRDSAPGRWVRVEGALAPSSPVDDEVKTGIESYHHPVSTLSGCALRVRAVNDAGIPGPWSELTLSDEEMSAAMLRFLRVDFLRAEARKDTGVVDVSWSVANKPPGMRFFVERKCLELGDTALSEAVTCSFADQPSPDGVKQYAYRVQSEWKGYRSDWSSSNVVRVGSAVPGEVKYLRYIYQDLAKCILSWNAPDWMGHGSIRFYEVEHHSGDCLKIGENREELRSGLSFLDKALPSSGFSHRVRAVNQHGAGPWSKVVGGIRLSRRVRVSQRGFTTSAAIFEVGQIVNGVVEGLQNYGAFVKLAEGFNGLLHRSELAWSGNPEVGDSLEVGDKLTLKVISIDLRHFKDKVGLSLKATRPVPKEIQLDPWDSFSKQYQAGDLVTGVVEGLVAFGAFIRLSPEIKGLLHKSKIGRTGVQHPGEVLQEGQTVNVRIVNIDLERRRVPLSLLGL